MVKHDGGMPMVNKQWLDITVKGRTISADRDAVVSYRVDNNTAYTTAATITASPTQTALTAITGRSIQPRITFNAFPPDPPTEVNSIEIRFRRLDVTKDVHTCLIEMYEGQVGWDGNPLPSPDVQYANLKLLENAAAVAYLDPISSISQTANVREVKVRERYQNAPGMPAILAEVIIEEV